MNDIQKRSFVRTASLAVAGLALALSLGACTDDSVGIFYQVATETDINKNMTDGLKEATPTFVARLGTTSYLGAGSLWTKADGKTKWTPSSVVKGVSTSAVFAVSGVAANGSLYVAFKGTDGSDLGIYGTTGGENWTKLDVTLSTGETIARLLCANNQVFLVTRATIDSTDSYKLYALSGATFTAMTVPASPRIGFPNSVAWDGSQYWFTAGGLILKGDTNALTQQTGPTVLSKAQDWTAETTSRVTTYGGVCAVGTSAVDTSVVVSGRSGILFHSADDGANWTSSAQQSYSSSSAYSFSIPSYVNVGAKPLVVVGTDTVARASADLPTAYGYMEYAVTALTDADAAKRIPDPNHATLSSASHYDSTLSGKIVTAMPLVDHGSGVYKLYALTQGEGLWSNTYDGSAWGNWVRE